MSEVEKQEGQRTVVAFITGLLIGGLLVWVFSSTPESAPQAETDEPTSEVSVKGDNEQEASVITATSDTVKTVVSGTGSITVNDQVAGNSVALGKTSYPTENGWIVVRDYKDGAQGNILGAARYSIAEGLTPASVSLLRDTVKGSSYQVTFHAENGDKKFSSKEDIVVEGVSEVFQAN